MRSEEEIKLKLKEVNEELSFPLDERGIIVLAFENSQDRQTCYLKGIQHILEWVLEQKSGQDE